MNIMFADWANRGLNLWTVKEANFTVTQGTSEYDLASDVVDVLDVVGRRDSTDYEIERISRGDYATFQINYSRQPIILVRPSNYSKDVLWSTPENSTDQIRYYYVRRIEDADALVNTTDMPFVFILVWWRG